jgi:3-oxoacyl-[acyl-carrier protein] reductase
MYERGFGRLLVISSVRVLGPTSPGVSAHGITKAALEAYVRWAADELGGDGVTVNALRLGFVDTASTASVPPQARDRLAVANPAARLGTPADIAAAASLLAQPAAGWVNGAIIPVTGGLNHPLNLARMLAPVQTQPRTRDGN